MRGAGSANHRDECLTRWERVVAVALSLGWRKGSNEKSHVVKRDVVSVLKIGSFLPAQEKTLLQVVE